MLKQLFKNPIIMKRLFKTQLRVPIHGKIEKPCVLLYPGAIKVIQALDLTIGVDEFVGANGETTVTVALLDHQNRKTSTGSATHIKPALAKARATIYAVTLLLNDLPAWEILE